MARHHRYSTEGVGNLATQLSNQHSSVRYGFRQSHQAPFGWPNRWALGYAKRRHVAEIVVFKLRAQFGDRL